jgi:transcription elongation factor Elf1
VLIDRGSTHNFIEQFVVTKFGLQVVCGKTNQVIVGNKEIIECTRCCTRLSLSIQGFIVQVDFYALSLAAYQAVLGVQ